jgi:hypothetical protein
MGFTGSSAVCIAITAEAATTAPMAATQSARFRVEEHRGHDGEEGRLRPREEAGRDGEEQDRDGAPPDGARLVEEREVHGQEYGDRPAHLDDALEDGEGPGVREHLEPGLHEERYPQDRIGRHLGGDVAERRHQEQHGGERPVVRRSTRRVGREAPGRHRPEPEDAEDEGRLGGEVAHEVRVLDEPVREEVDDDRGPEPGEREHEQEGVPDGVDGAAEQRHVHAADGDEDRRQPQGVLQHVHED